MSKPKLVVLGAGIGGRVISKYLKNKYSDKLDILLVSKECKLPKDLFYFDSKIEGVAEREISVRYDLNGERDINKFIVKSKGNISDKFNENLTTSFDKVGTTEKGYLLNEDLDEVDIPYNATKINTLCKWIDLDNNERINFDLLISTIPLPIFIKLNYNPNLSGFRFINSDLFEKVETFSSEEDFNRIEVVYDTTDSEFYRISHFFKDDTLIKTVSETLSENSDYVKVSPGKISRLKEADNYIKTSETLFNVKFCGRYARWDYHYLVTTSVKDAEDYIKLNIRRNKL